MWQWEIVPENLTPTGNGVCGGEVITSELYSVSGSSSTSVAQTVFNLNPYSSSLASSTLELWVGTRDLYSSSRSASSLDVASGLTILSDYGMRVDNVNTIRLGGVLLESNTTPSRNQDVTVRSSPSDEIPYYQIVDTVSDFLIYKGWAEVGSLTSAPVWRIQKIVIGFDDDVTKTWAEGNAEFDNVWDDHLSLVYS